MRDEGLQRALEEIRAIAEEDARAEVEAAKPRWTWEYCVVLSTLIPGVSFWDSPYELRLAGSERTFQTPDIALRELGAEGWECIQFHQDDGPRQQMIPMSLIQPPSWPTQYILRFKREVEGQ